MLTEISSTTPIVAMSNPARDRILAAERQVSWVRLAVVSCGTFVSLVLADKVPHAAALAPLLAISWIYALWVHLFAPYRRFPPLASSYVTPVFDGAVSTIWIWAHGGIGTPWYALYYLGAIAVSFRYGRRATLVAATLYAIVYTALIAAMGQLAGNEATVVIRIFLLFAIGSLVGLAAQDAIAREAARLESESQAARALAAEAELKSLNENLELRVRERTAAADRQNAELARSREQLRVAKDAAEAASQAKSSFLANMSHEIRTPLGVMIGFSELLLEQAFGPLGQREYLQKIRANGEQLLALVNDILDLSKVEAGRLETERSPFSLSALMEDILSVLSPSALARGLVLTLTAGEAVPDFVSSDRKRLRQILLNVIGNAVKFTEQGEVSVALSAEARAGAAIELSFLVKDSGPGLTAAQAEKLFAPFVQADSSATRKFGGTGLGLALSRRLARALGGDVTLSHSEPGRGSTFQIRVEATAIAARTLDGARPVAEDFGDAVRPTTAAAGQRPPVDDGTRATIDERLTPMAPPPPAHRVLEGLAILLVEDAVDNQLLISRFLKLAGALVTVASNGKEGVDAARGGGLDLVLMDIQMPVMNGIQAMRALRDDGFAQPIIALTAHAMKEDREGCLELGFDDHITKPIDRTGLIERIAHFCKDAPPVRARASTTLPC